MTLQVISLGFGRTATLSLKAALEELGFGPCYHMDVVLQDMEERVRGWNAAVEGRPDWDAIYSGFHSAVDWPSKGLVLDDQKSRYSNRRGYSRCLGHRQGGSGFLLETGLDRLCL